MGMYTELSFASKLKKDLPEEVLNALRYMTGVLKDKPEKLPEHELFKTMRWEYMFASSSAYFDAEPHCELRWDEFSQCYYLQSISDIKDYDNEIEKFIDWIMPYLDKYDGEFLGYSRYEEFDQPDLIYYKEIKGCDHDYKNAVRLGRANYVCPTCDQDITIDLHFLNQAGEKNIPNP